MLFRVRFSWAKRLLVLATLLHSVQLRAQTPTAVAQTPTAVAQTPTAVSEQAQASQQDAIALPRALSTPLVYPEGASGEATVVLELTLDREGTVLDARALAGDAPFRDAALAAAQSWRFTPALRGGRPVPAKVR